MESCEKRLTQRDAGLLICKKTVAVVGNAKTALLNTHGNLIDQHDVVVRFNRGIPRSSVQYKHLGRKTTILAGFRFSRDQWRLNGKPTIFYRGPWSRDYVPHRRWPGVVEWRAEQGREDCISAYTKKGPSNGVMLLEVLVNLFEPKLIRMFGFDFFKTLSWYPESKGKIGEDCHHDGYGEERYIREVLGFKECEYKGVLEWTPSS